MDYAKYDEKLRRRQVAYEEGIHLLRMTRGELTKTISSADNWGLVAVLSNAVLVPANIIVNTFLPFKPTSKFQEVVKFVYEQTAASGTRQQTEQDEDVSEAIGELGKQAIDFLTRSALTEYVPAVRILTGFAQDAQVLMRVATQVSEGQREMRQQLLALDRQIGEFLRIMMEVGIERALLHDKMAVIQRTA